MNSLPSLNGDKYKHYPIGFHHENGYSMVGEKVDINLMWWNHFASETEVWKHAQKCTNVADLDCHVSLRNTCENSC